jgi:glycosyltransferase involved in cell wall biosynthesis
VSLPYYSFEIALVEAMSCGLAVVANNDAIRREIVGEAGILVDPDDLDQYKRAIKSGLSKFWGEVPRKQAEKFSWDKIALQYIQLIDKLIK